MGRDLYHHFNEVEELDPTNGYGERSVPWFKDNILPDMLATKERLNLGPNLLDVGCAHGYYTAEYAKYFDHVTGADWSENRIADANNYNHAENIDYMQFDLTQDSFPVFYDCAVSSACLQHIDPRGGKDSPRYRAFKAVRDALHPGDYFIMYDEEFDSRPDTWSSDESWYEPLRLPWMHEHLKDLFVVESKDFLCRGGHGEYIYRFTLRAV